MFISLLEKLRRIDEVVATAVDPQKVLKNYYKGKPTKLTLSTWPSSREENQYKFWLLTDGAVIPVEYSHDRTLADAQVEDEEMQRHTWASFVETGAVGGYFNLVSDEMGVTAGKKLTSKQIAKLKNLYLDYKVSMLYMDVRPRHFQSSIKSISHLDYLLTYGKDVDESETEQAIQNLTA